jgi:uncharacterized protein (TIGR03118 family)
MGTTDIPRSHRSVVVCVVAVVALVAAALTATALAASDNQYTVANLVSDEAGVAAVQDTSLVNGWGLDAFPGSPWWVANNGTSTSSLYRANGTSPRTPVNVPGRPTGLVANIASVNGSFQITNGTTTVPALFLFSTEAGKIYGWQPSVALDDAVDTNAETTPGAIYKGLAIASTAGGDFLYATDFHNGRVDVFDGTFQQASLPAGAFTDPSLPPGYAPFGVQNVGGGWIVVTYAQQDEEREDEIAGQAKGFVDLYTTSGALVARIGEHGQLNAPWGIARAPADGFGRFGGDLLVGNFGDGEITAFEPQPDGSWEQVGQLRSGHKVLAVDGLWALEFGKGNATNNGPPTTLFFTAGPDDEQHGLFGTITAG